MLQTNIFLGIFFLTTISTNWQAIPGDLKREGTTNFLHQVQVLQTNTLIIEVQLCTNRTMYKTVSGPTNGVLRWTTISEALAPGVVGRQ